MSTTDKAAELARIDIRIRVDPILYDRIVSAAHQEGNSIAAFLRSAAVKELTYREKGHPPASY